MLRQANPARRVGFTLVELLVVITIIGILIAILLPAVQAARESARRMACSNNLRQMGIGLLAYHADYGTFPSGGIEPRSAYGTSGRQLAWCAFLLAHIDQQPLHDMINFGKAFDSEENAPAASTILPVFLCPTVDRVSYRIEGRGAIDYGGLYGERIRFPGGPARQNNPPKGVMLYGRAISIADIKDGTSNTLIISEDSAWPDGQWINGLNVFDQAYAINFPPDPAHGIYLENEIRSLHTGGANGLFCDGSVRFLNDTMSLRSLAAICSRAGGETIGN